MDYTLHEWVRMASHHGSIARCAIEKQTEESGLDQLIADNDYDQILVLYSFDSFKSDPYLYRAGVTG